MDEIDVLAEALVPRAMDMDGHRDTAAGMGDAVHQLGVRRAVAAVTGRRSTVATASSSASPGGSHRPPPCRGTMPAR